MPFSLHFILFQLNKVLGEPTRITLFITNKPENIINSGVVQLGSIYMTVEKSLCVKTFIKLLKREILSTIKYLILNKIFILLSHIVSGTLMREIHYGNSLETNSMRLTVYMLLSDKGELKVNTHSR